MTNVPDTVELNQVRKLHHLEGRLDRIKTNITKQAQSIATAFKTNPTPRVKWNPAGRQANKIS